LSAAQRWRRTQAHPRLPFLGRVAIFGEVIDGSTADDARRKIEAAGFADVRDLKKSCDNFWHGKATLTGRAVNVVLSPRGKVMLESD
jgi:hypothetical protein